MQPGIGQMDVFPSIWGHWAGGPGDSKKDMEWLDDKLKVFFEGVSVKDGSSTTRIHEPDK